MKTQLCACLEWVRHRPDFAGGIAEDSGSKALSNTNQAGPINLHYEVIHLDPTDTKRTLYAERCLEKTKVAQWTHLSHATTNVTMSVFDQTGLWTSTGSM